MRRLLVLTFAVLLALPAAAHAAPAASVAVLACTTALAPSERSATFEARVRKRESSARMQVRFRLEMREPGGAWRPLAAEGFDRWLTSRAGVRRYSYAKTVQNLTAPASYRTVVRFRWLDRRGRLLLRASRTSKVCRQPDLRADLVADGVSRGARGAAGAAALSRVRAQRRAHRRGPVRGRASWPARRRRRPARWPGLGIAERTVVSFLAPACAAGEPLTVTLDPGAAVDERDELHNVLVVPCPG